MTHAKAWLNSTHFMSPSDTESANGGTLTTSEAPVGLPPAPALDDAEGAAAVGGGAEEDAGFAVAGAGDPPAPAFNLNNCCPALTVSPS